MCKDQVYLRGTFEILQNRNKIDFWKFHAGKLSLKDYFKLCFSQHDFKLDGNLKPYFLKDIEEYKRNLDIIAECNFIK